MGLFKIVLSFILGLFIQISFSYAFEGDISCKSAANALKGSKQIMVVTTKDAEGAEAQFNAFEKDSKGWVSKFGPIEARLGRKGLGWGSGLHQLNKKQSENIEFRKKFYRYEGSSKSPAGIFSLGMNFTNDKKLMGLKNSGEMVVITKGMHCGDSSKHPGYNQIFTEGFKLPNLMSLKTGEFGSTEKLIRYVDKNDPKYGDYMPYRIATFVNFNTDPKNFVDSYLQKGFGSCIFLHCMHKDKRGTSGCTAMDCDTLKKVVSWRDDRKKPLLIQLTSERYSDLRTRCKGQLALPKL